MGTDPSGGGRGDRPQDKDGMGTDPIRNCECRRTTVRTVVGSANGKPVLDRHSAKGVVTHPVSHTYTHNPQGHAQSAETRAIRRDTNNPLVGV